MEQGEGRRTVVLSRTETMDLPLPPASLCINPPLNLFSVCSHVPIHVCVWPKWALCAPHDKVFHVTWNLMQSAELKASPEWRPGRNCQVGLELDDDSLPLMCSLLDVTQGFGLDSHFNQQRLIEKQMRISKLEWNYVGAYIPAGSRTPW